MKEEFLPILKSLEKNVEEIIHPLEVAQLDYYQGDASKVHKGQELIMGELLMVILMLTGSDEEISEGELELLDDMRHVVYGYGIRGFNSDDYFELARKFLRAYPGRAFTLDHAPLSVRVLQEYDVKHGTDFAGKAWAIFTQFTDAIILADNKRDTVEMVVLENFKHVLNADIPSDQEKAV